MKHDVTLSCDFKLLFLDFPFAISYNLGQYYFKIHAHYTMVFITALCIM